MNTLSKTNPPKSSSQQLGMGGFKKLINEMKAKQFDSIRFAAYRTACKLRYIQQRTRLILLDVRGVVESFRQSGLYLMEPSCSLDRAQIESMVSQLYSQLASRLPAGDQLHPSIVPESIEMLLGWLLYSYDTSGTGRLTVMALKVALSTLASGKPVDKFKYHFTLLTDPSGALIPTRFEQYLHDVLVLAVGVFEGPNFAYNSQASKFILGGRSKAIVIEEFLEKMLADPGPQCLLWLNIFHRLSNIENVRHNVRCEGCHREVIIGFRYKCQKCHNYNLCQDCFWTGVTTGNHSNSHDVKEYTSSSKSHSRQFGHAIRKSWDRQNNVGLAACAGGVKPSSQSGTGTLQQQQQQQQQVTTQQQMAAMNYSQKFGGPVSKLVTSNPNAAQGSPCMPYRNTVARMQDPNHYRASPHCGPPLDHPSSMAMTNVTNQWTDSTNRIAGGTPMPHHHHMQQHHHGNSVMPGATQSSKDWRQYYHDDEHRLIARYASTLASSRATHSHLDTVTSSTGPGTATNQSGAHDSTDAPKIEVHLRSELFSQNIPTSAKSQKELINKLEAKNREILREIQRLRLEQQQNASAVSAAANKSNLSGGVLESLAGGAGGQSSGLGGITNPNLLAELRSLRHRKDELESRMNSLQDSRLELMQQLESLMRVLNTSSTSNTTGASSGPTNSTAPITSAPNSILTALKSRSLGPPATSTGINRVAVVTTSSSALGGGYASPLAAHRSFSYSAGGPPPVSNTPDPPSMAPYFSSAGPYPSRLSYLTGPPRFNTLTRHSRTFSADEGLGGFGISGGAPHTLPPPGNTGSLSSTRRYVNSVGPGGMSLGHNTGVGTSRTLDSLGLVDSDSFHIKSLSERPRGPMKEQGQMDFRRDLLAAADNVTSAMSGLVRELQPSGGGGVGGMNSNNKGGDFDSEYEDHSGGSRRLGVNSSAAPSSSTIGPALNSSSIFSNSRISSRVLSDQRFINELRARRQHQSSAPPPDNLLGESPPPALTSKPGPPPLPPHRSRGSSTNATSSQVGPPIPTLHSNSEYMTSNRISTNGGIHPPSQYHHSVSAESDSEAYLYSDPECSLIRNNGPIQAPPPHESLSSSHMTNHHHSLGRSRPPSSDRNTLDKDSRLSDIQNINQKITSLNNGDMESLQQQTNSSSSSAALRSHNNNKDSTSSKNSQNWEESINRWINE